MFKLNNENFYQYAYQGLKNPYTSEIEFSLLLKHIVYIKRLLKKYKNNYTNINVNLLLNHFIIIFNEFDVRVANHILFFEISHLYYPQIKSILLFLNKIKNNEIFMINDSHLHLSEIQIDNQLLSILNKLVSK